jgi:hypothetical protein
MDMAKGVTRSSARAAGQESNWRLLDDVENIYILEFSNAFMAPRHQKSVVARS